MAVSREEVVVKMGMDTTELEAGASRGLAFMERFQAKAMNRINKGIMGLLGLNAIGLVIGMLKEKINEFVDWAWEKITSKLYGSVEALEDQGKELDNQMKKLNESAEKRKAAQKELKELEKKDAYDKLTDVQKLIEHYKTIRDLQKEISLIQKQGKSGDENKLAADRLALFKEIQIYNGLAKTLNEGKGKDAAKVKADREALTTKETARAKELVEGGRYGPTLSRIEQLEGHARFRMLFHDPTTARKDLTEAMRLRLAIRDDLRAQAIQNLSPEQKIMMQILDMIGGNKDGVPVKVVNLDNK